MADISHKAFRSAPADTQKADRPGVAKASNANLPCHIPLEKRLLRDKEQSMQSRKVALVVLKPRSSRRAARRIGSDSDCVQTKLNTKATRTGDRTET